MRKFNLIAPCHFGLEAVLKAEVSDLGYEIVKVDDGRVTFAGDADAVARANVFLRTAERVLLEVGEFEARTYDELFEGTKALPWEEFLPEDARFWVKKASTVKSKLFSPSDIQSIMKKAMVERMKQKYHCERFVEDGDDYPVRVFLYKDKVTVALDTTGDSLHKRGYRKQQGLAPIAENLAAALIKLTPWRADRILVDPFCGSGTIPIEAAMMAANIAPGMDREFTAETWTNIVDKKSWYNVIDEAQDLVNTDIETEIQGYDIDPEMIKIAKANAERAGVDHLIHFQARPAKELSHAKKYGFIITNPPYGERMEEKAALVQLYGEFGQACKKLDTWSTYIISSYEDTERSFGKKAVKNRKIYNGMIKTYYYMYPGPRPPKRSGSEGR
ncbi:MAG: class I SAM-dependent RNA methyltransferase [Lachnospiraceae bacterium]|nr:class I SAM-dependent RNA methyltransferase [Lachnospiraceae bacterium]